MTTPYLRLGMLKPSALLAAIGVLCAPGAHAQSVDNFVLLDHRGEAHELYYHEAAEAIAIMGHATQCETATDDIQAFNDLAGSDTTSGRRFFFLNASLTDDRSAMSLAAKHHGIELPILDDETQLIGESLNLTQAGEVIVINPANWTITYRGGVANLAAALNGEAPTTARINGCPLDLNPGSSDLHISYHDDVAPILMEKCVVCHTNGGIGPWAMSSYTMVLGFSPMIREVLRTRRMPPWHADPHVGVWKNDISLSNEQTQTLIRWIEAGSPRGDGPDPLAETRFVHAEWPLGEPDLILNIPEFTVPASGVVDYQFPAVENPLDHGVWIRAASVMPGDREVVHHILAGTLNAGTPAEARARLEFDNYLIGYAPGNESHTFPEGTGVYVPPGGQFLFQMHYTPIGRSARDQSKIGLYFLREKPEKFYRQDVVINPTITIPPHEARHQEIAYYVFDKPALLHDLVPHAHYRGVASKFDIEHPDGIRETILSVPNYDFNWQRTYEFVEPKRIAAGSRLIHTTWYDNSSANPGNPDPDRAVPWGLQSWDEMLYGAFSYTYIDETTEAPIHDETFAQTSKFIGFLDKNLDGKVSWRELPKNIKRRLVQGFKAVDTDGDGGLNLQEMQQLTERMREARANRNDQEKSADAR